MEDNAIVVQDKAIINYLGAESRRKEVSGVENALKEVSERASERLIWKYST